MRNRPLCSVCLMVFLIFSIGMTAGGSRFFRELVPPEMKKQAGKEVQITGQVYQIEVRESYQILYLILSKKTSRILVYDDAKQPVQIGNKVNVKGELSLFEEARNPGNFNQKFYYEKQKIGAFLWAEALRVTDRESNPLKQGLYELRQKWKRILIDAAGEEDGGALAAILLGEKQGMDREIRELYQVNGIAHVLAVSGVKTLKLDIPLVPEIRINWAFAPLHIAIIYILKLCLDEEIIPRCRFPCSRGYFKKCINWQNKKSFSVSQSYRKSLKNQQKEK